MKRIPKPTVKLSADKFKRLFLISPYFSSKKDHDTYKNILNCKTLDEVSELLGSQSFTKNPCDICFEETTEAVTYIEIPDKDSIYICDRCIEPIYEILLPD